MTRAATAQHSDMQRLHQAPVVIPSCAGATKVTAELAGGVSFQATVAVQQ